MTVNDQSTKAIFGRSAAILLAVSLLLSSCVFIGHEWFFTKLLPALGLKAALGCALGVFAIVIFVFLAQRLISLVLFGDFYFGLLQSNQQFRRAKEEMLLEIGQLDELASTDRLTGVWNRRHFEELVGGEIKRLKRYDYALSMLMVDIDHFKVINDNHGHNVGDQVLVTLTTLLRSSLRAPDTLTRWGGEEFIILCPSTPLVTAVVLAERLRAQVSQSDFETVGRVTVSIGVSQCLTEEEWPQWLDRADAALYRAKRNGRNQVQFAPETPSPKGSVVRRPTHLVHLSWHETYACGHDTIDHEHRLLFSMANELLNAIFLGKSVEEIREIIGLLTVEVAAHFQDEEVIIAAIGFPGATEHAQLHKTLLTKARRLASAFDAGTTEIGSIFQFLAYDVIATHMLKADWEFFPYLKTGTGTSYHGSPTRH